MYIYFILFHKTKSTIVEFWLKSSKNIALDVWEKSNRGKEYVAENPLDEAWDWQ